MNKIPKRNLISVHISSGYSLSPRHLLFLFKTIITKKDQAKCLQAY